ncbi:DKNYY domain-containing protein [Burkholderia cepacia]|uniref:DKNYY domain-containing protein n=1 Tax=Burkholderia cepacia TaxID=292 RepID=UPI002FE3CB97
MTLRENLGFGFMRDDAHVYCHDGPLRDRAGNLIEGIAIDSFRPLSRYLATDGVRAYACTFTWLRFTVLDVDAATFRLLDESHAVDANHVYFQNRKLAGASPARFRLLSESWGHDDRYLYYYGKRMRGADPATLRWVGAYLVDAQRVWYGGRALEGADAASFVSADEVAQDQATDRARPYRYGHADDPGPREQWERNWSPFFAARPELQGYWWHALIGQAVADVSTRELGGGYRVVGDQVYLHDLPLLEPDAGTVRWLGDSFIADHSRLYSYSAYHKGFLRGGPLPGDPAQWRHLGGPWYQAGDHCYRQQWRGHAEAAKVDGKTFEILNDTYAKDRNGVLCMLVRKRGIDPARIEVVGDDHLREGGRLFYFGKEVKARFDAPTAEPVGHGFLRDGQGRLLHYNQPYRRGVDGATLTFLSEYFARDRARAYVYCNGAELVPLPGVDPAAFHLEQPDIGTDGSRRYVYQAWLAAWRARDRSPMPDYVPPDYVAPEAGARADAGPAPESVSANGFRQASPAGPDAARRACVIEWARDETGESRLVVAGDGFCDIWDLAQRQVVASFALPRPFVPDETEATAMDRLRNVPVSASADASLSTLIVAYWDNTALYRVDAASGAADACWRADSRYDDPERVHLSPDAREAWVRIRNRLYRVPLAGDGTLDVLDYDLADQRFQDAPFAVSASRHRRAFARDAALTVRTDGATDCDIPGADNGFPCAFSDDGTRVLARDAKFVLREFDVDSGKRLALHRGGWCERKWFKSQAGWIGGRPVFVGLPMGGQGEVDIWDVLDNRLLFRIEAAARVPEPDAG